MNLSQAELELMLLKHISSDAKSMDQALRKGICEYHFAVNDGTNISFNGKMFSLMKEYFTESGGLLFTDLVLDNALISKNAKDKVKSVFVSLWAEIQDTDIDLNDFHAVIMSIKRNYALKLMSEMFQTGKEVLSDNGINDTIEVMRDYISNISNEMLDYPNEKREFDIAQISSYFQEEYEKRIQYPELYRGIECGLSMIDSHTFGWMPEQLIVLLAPTGGGKSIQMLNWAMHANKVQNKKVLYFSFEMSGWLCLMRHLSLCFKIPYSAIKGVRLSREQLQNIISGLEKINKDAYFIYDVNMATPTPEYVDAKIREITQSKGKPDLVVCDYIGNMYSTKSSKSAKNWEKQGDALEELFHIARNRSIPILTAQQMNRSTVTDTRKAKESGKAIEFKQDAASGDQRLMHLAHYIFALEPDRDNNICWYHFAKARDAVNYKTFAAKIDPEYNAVIQLSDAEQEKWQAFRRAEKGATDNVVTEQLSVAESLNLNDNAVEIDNLEIDMSGWDVG